ncbi:MAG: deoxyribose-phosphate aldolase [Planctomycetota bacterium]
MTADEVARRIDHTLLRAEATAGDIDALCDEACAHGFKTVCVNPIHVRRAAQRLSAFATGGEDRYAPGVCSVAGFPLGAAATATKADEGQRAIDDGAVEIDMVANIGALIGGDHITVRKDIEAVASVVHQACPTGILKVILETGILTEEQIAAGCRCCVEGGADFVKTSTGFHPAGGATIEHVRLLCRHASPIPIKAAGGIRTAGQALAVLDAGASRIGTSSGVGIIEQLRRSVP